MLVNENKVKKTPNWIPGDLLMHGLECRMCCQRVRTFFLVDLFVPELNPHHQNDLFDLSNILLIGQFVNLVIITSQLFLPPVEN